MIDPVVAFFLLGLIARLGRSDLRVPEPLYEALSIFLLLAIGLKGGVQLSVQPLSEVWAIALAAMGWSALIPVLLSPVLIRLVKLGRIDAAAVAAHYGSVSVVTFAVAQTTLSARGLTPEPWMALLVALMEAPGIVVGIVLARRAQGSQLPLAAVVTSGSTPSRVPSVAGVTPPGARGVGTAWGRLLHEVVFGKAIVLLIGGLLIGWAFGPVALAPIDPLFSGLFRGVLALFLLELGLVVGQRLPQLRQAGWRLVAFGVLAPIALGLTGTVLAWWVGLSLPGMVVFAALSASASYIAAPTALRMAVPQADPGLSIGAALGVSFPFNVVFGIPIYLAWAEWLVR
jgi:hypothetical protein